MLAFPDIKLAYTGSELLNKAGLGDEHAGACDAYIFRKDKVRSRFLMRSQCSEKYSKGPWTSRVFFVGGRSGSREFKELKVWCNCTFFKYFGPMYNSVANDFDDSGRKRVKAPDVRDPKRSNWLCKHLVKAIPLALGDRNAYYESLGAKQRILQQARERRAESA